MTGVEHRPTVLALRGGGLGDVLTAVPALRTIRAGLPHHRLVLAGPLPPGALLQEVGVVDGVVPVTARRLRPPWSGPPPDVAVNLHGRGPQSHLALAALDPDRMVAFSCAAAGFHAGPGWESGVPQPEAQRSRWVRLAMTLPAAPCHDHTLPVPRLHRSGAAPVIVHPGAASPSRRWPVARFGQVAGLLARRGHRVVVTGSAPESSLVADVLAVAAHPGVRARVGADLWTFARFVGGARLVVCGDTGVGHLAAALGRPSVHLMGPSDPREWGPAPGPHHVLWSGSTGDPHAPVPDRGLLRIGVDEVLAAAERALAAPAPLNAVGAAAPGGEGSVA